MSAKHPNASADQSRRQFLGSVVTGSVGLLAAGVSAKTPTAPASEIHGDVQYTPPTKKPIDVRIHLNQVGCLPHEPKRAVIAATGAVLGNEFVLVDDAVVPTIRHRGTLTEFQNTPKKNSKKNSKKQPAHFGRHFFADFSAFTRPGRYRLRLSDGHLSVPFTIGSDIYEQVVPLILQYFDIQLCGPQQSAHRGPCHTDDGMISGGPRSGQRIDVVGGWHDAGDYLKFVETTSYVTALMLAAYDRYAAHYDRALAGYFLRGSLPLPLAYAKVGLDWLLKMHPHPDEFYYQVGDDTDHDSWRLPEQDTPAHDPKWKPRPVFYGVGANLAGRTAAAFAIASRLYRSADPAYAARCLAAARSVYALGLKHPKVVTTKPYDFYPETTWQDDMEWGAIELYKAASEPAYLAQALRFAHLAGPAHTYTSVYNVHALAHGTLYDHAPAADQTRLLEYLRVDAKAICKRSEASPYGLGVPYVWGTAEAAAGAAINCLIYARISGDRSYAEIARRQRDFVLGTNPFSICCLVGAGTQFPLFPHHQVANLKNIELTGAIVGGPADLKTYLEQHTSLSKTEFSAQSPSPILAEDRADQTSVYHDVVEDYVTNEPANDYTAKFLLLTAYYMKLSDEA